jgi:tRNA threonylcarbamoyladenosine biosynthesis protein TsaE
LNTTIEYTANSTEELKGVAVSIINSFPDQRIFILNGDLGSGKTTFVKAFAVALGIVEEITSPTFSIVHEYGNGNVKVFHFDLYRLENEQELYQIGFEEYMDENAYVFIEWPALAFNFLPTSYVSVSFEAESENTRRIICSVVN